MKIVAVVALMAVLAGCSSPIPGAPVAAPAPVISVEDRTAAETKRSLQHWVDTQPLLKPLKLAIVNVEVIHLNGNEYKGVTTVRTFQGTTRDVILTIVVDGEKSMWESEKGAFGWVYEDGFPPGTAEQPTALLEVDGWSSFRTKTGKSQCQMTVDFVECQVAFDPPKFGGGQQIIGFNFDGSLTWLVGDGLEGQLDKINYGFYRALNWTIEADVNGTRFTRDNGDTVHVSTSGVTVG